MSLPMPAPKMIYLKPAEGRRVRRPAMPHTPLPAHGAELADAPFWQRRLKAGDVEETTKEEVEAGELAALEQLKEEQAAAAE